MKATYKCDRCGVEFNDRDECDRHEKSCDRTEALMKRVDELAARLHALEERVEAMRTGNVERMKDAIELMHSRYPNVVYTESRTEWIPKDGE